MFVSIDKIWSWKSLQVYVARSIGDVVGMVMVYVDDVWRTKIIHESKLKVFWSQFCFRK
jgi:hypothetical protein